MTIASATVEGSDAFSSRRGSKSCQTLRDGGLVLKAVGVGVGVTSAEVLLAEGLHDKGVSSSVTRCEHDSGIGVASG